MLNSSLQESDDFYLQYRPFVTGYGHTSETIVGKKVKYLKLLNYLMSHLPTKRQTTGKHFQGTFKDSRETRGLQQGILGDLKFNTIARCVNPVVGRFYIFYFWIPLSRSIQYFEQNHNYTVQSK